MMPETHEPASELVLEIKEGVRDEITLIGSSLRGHVYRSRQHPACYRLIPIESLSLEDRDRIRRWIERPRKPGLAPVVDVRQALSPDGVLAVRYEVRSERSWSDIINSSDLSQRLECGSRILRRFPRWLDEFEGDPNGCHFFMPADVVFADGAPVLLGLPTVAQPEVESVFALPRRAIYLPPEYVRGQASEIWGSNVDVYALGVSLIQCLFSWPEQGSAEQLLLSGATGTIQELAYRKSRLPFWLKKLPACRALISELQQLIHPDCRVRSSVDLHKLADRLESYREQLQPEAIIEALRAAGKPAEAFALLLDILLEQSSYDLLLLGGEIAWRDLRRPLDAIDLLERAIDRDRGNPSAYERQLDVILTGMPQLKRTAGEELDRRTWRDFHSLPVALQQEYEKVLARYLMWRKQFDEAANFIYPRLFHAQQFQWWKFDMTLAYAEVFLRKGQLEEAKQQMASIKASLKLVRDNRTLTPQDIHRYGTALSELELALFQLQAGQ